MARTESKKDVARRFLPVSNFDLEATAGRRPSDPGQAHPGLFCSSPGSPCGRRSSWPEKGS